MFYRWASRPFVFLIINLIYRLCLHPSPHAHLQNNWRSPGFLRLHGAHARKCHSTVHKSKIRINVFKFLYYKFDARLFVFLLFYVLLENMMSPLLVKGCKKLSLSSTPLSRKGFLSCQPVMTRGLGFCDYLRKIAPI